MNKIRTLFFRMQNLIAKNLFMTVRIKTRQKEVFLTFDDGPEEGIAPFILSELGRHGFLATFFCRGDNAARYPDLLQQLVAAGHSIGNHTFCHIHAYDTSAREYVEDIERAEALLHTGIARPPFGSIRFSQLVRLRRHYRLVYWSLDSGDSRREINDPNLLVEKLCRSTRPGDIVLFHCCKQHEANTRAILPRYLDWLSSHGFRSCPIPDGRDNLPD